MPDQAWHDGEMTEIPNQVRDDGEMTEIPDQVRNDVKEILKQVQDDE